MTRASWSGSIRWKTRPRSLRMPGLGTIQRRILRAGIAKPGARFTTMDLARWCFFGEKPWRPNGHGGDVYATDGVFPDRIIVNKPTKAALFIVVFWETLSMGSARSAIKG